MEKWKNGMKKLLPHLFQHSISSLNSLIPRPNDRGKELKGSVGRAVFHVIAKPSHSPPERPRKGTQGIGLAGNIPSLV